MIGPRTTLSGLVDLNYVSHFVWDCHPVVLPSSQSCEWIALLRYAVVGFWTVESGIVLLWYAVVGLAVFCVALAMCKPALTLIP